MYLKIIRKIVKLGASGFYISAVFFYLTVVNEINCIYAGPWGGWYYRSMPTSTAPSNYLLSLVKLHKCSLSYGTVAKATPRATDI